jgi:hypothetical protein
MHQLLSAALEDVLHLRRFNIGPGYHCRIEKDVAETCRWELFRGNLLDPAFTREEKSFRSWQVFVERPEQPPPMPMLSLKWDQAAHLLHVTRNLEVQGWEAFSQGNLIDSRPVRKWQPELIGTLDLVEVENAGMLAALLRHYLHLAVVGSSRLPITSVESPLPFFSLGLLAYDPSEPVSKNAYAVKRLEAMLRAVPPRTPEQIVAAWPEDRLLPLLRSLFHQVALSPYTHFIDTWVSLLRYLSHSEPWGVAAIVDLVSEYLRLLVRHLTAFDLHKFHNLGANYPDALFLDLLLRLYLDLLAQQPALASGEEPAARLRRRALRQAWSARRMYEGHRVPDAPTSPGENVRVLPEPFQPVPEEQLTQSQKRSRRLFADTPSEALLSPVHQEILRHSLRDFVHEAERRELGLALFLDRPLGVFKLAQGQLRDRTPLLSYLAYSPKIARQRLQLWQEWGWLTAEERGSLGQRFTADAPVSIPALELPLPTSRPGVICLEDMLQVSVDFLLLRTTTGSLAAFWQQYDSSPLRQLGLDPNVTLLMRSPRSRLSADPAPFLTGFDAQMRPRWELTPATEPAYREWAGVEYLTDGLRLLRAWDEQGQMITLPSEPVLLRPLRPMPEENL